MCLVNKQVQNNIKDNFCCLNRKWDEQGCDSIS